MVYAKKEADIKDFGRVLYSDAPFDEALSAIESKDGKIITLNQLAYARMQKNSNHSLSQNGSYVKEGILYAPNVEHKRILLRDSLVLKNPVVATSVHRSGEEYLLGKDFNVNEFLEKLSKGNYLLLDNTNPVPTNRFGEDERMVWAFGKIAQEYGLFLKDAGISQTGFYTDGNEHIKSQGQPYANQLWLRRLGSDSVISGSGRILNSNSRVRGVQSIGEADASKKNVVQTYTSRQVQNMVNKTLQNVGISGSIKKTIVLDLEKRLK
jgi:hypothetical protein